MTDDSSWQDEEGDVKDDIADAIDAGIPVEKAFRLSLNKSIEELATASGIDPHRLTRIEAGATPSDRELSKLGAALKVPPDILVDE